VRPGETTTKRRASAAARVSKGYFQEATDTPGSGPGAFSNYAALRRGRLYRAVSGGDSGGLPKGSQRAAVWTTSDTAWAAALDRRVPMAVFLSRGRLVRRACRGFVIAGSSTI